MSDGEELYYVQDSRSYVGNSVLWWRPDGQGYTTHIDKAGKYTAAEVKGMRSTDVPWPVKEVDKVWSHHVDAQHLRRLPDIRSHRNEIHCKELP
jgi:hypothetical protein